MKPFTHGGNIYEEKAPGGGWLDYSANINPLGLAPAVRKAIEASIGEIVHYPDPEARELKAALAFHYHLPQTGLVLGNGAAELFYLFMQAVRPRRVLLPVPSFSEYERAALAARTEICYHYLQSGQGFLLDIGALARQAQAEECDAIILGNPNNPTGGLVTGGQIKELLQLTACAGAPWLVVDESFLDFRADAADYTVRNLAAAENRLLVVQSLTKFYALPGLRLGFGVASPQLVQRLELGKDVWNVNLLAQKAGVAALAAREYALETQALVAAEGKWLAGELARLPGWQVYGPTVNFILVRLQEDSGTAARRLREQGILVRDCSNYPGLEAHYLRFAVRTHAENRQLVEALHKIQGITV